MKSGLPDDPGVLSKSLLAVSRGLALLAWQPDYREPLCVFGLYLGQPYLSWFDDGYGVRMGLAVPNSVEPEALARFVRQRLTEPRLAATD